MKERAGEVWDIHLFGGKHVIVVLLGLSEIDSRERELQIALTLYSELTFVSVGNIGPWDPEYFKTRHDSRRIA